MINLNTVYIPSPKIVVRDTGGEYILVPVTDNIADMNSVYTLNDTGVFIWKHLDGIKSVQDIINRVEEEYDVEKKQAAEDVLDFFSGLKEYLIIVE